MNLRIRLTPMSDSAASDIKLPLKKPWKVGKNTVVVIDKSLVERLGLDEENTIFQETIVSDGILLKIVRQDSQGVISNAV
jgi:hypothetical protein